ncbi:MAG: hypothetical protein E7167_03880 [Firmicutes bacterium]|nr:hypothetical protein [Bacillota bacterium]
MNAEEIYISSLFFLSSGIDAKTINNPFEYLKNKAYSMLNEQVLDFIYQNIIMIPKENNVTTEEVISFLIRDFIDCNPDENNYTIKYLNSASRNNVFNFFRENKYFAHDLIASYFKNLGREKSEEFNSFYGLKAKFTTNFQIDVISNMLRRAFANVYSAINLLNCGSLIPAQVFLLTLRGKAFISGNPKIEKDINLLQAYQPLLFRLMYADIYEYLVFSNIIKSEKRIAILINEAITNGNYNIPNDETNLGLLYTYFGYLAGSPEKRASSRKNLDEESLGQLKNINPLWMFDESDIISKR